MKDQKNIMVLAHVQTIEGLRMASGLTLLDDGVRVVVTGALDRSDSAVELQLEALEFADVGVYDIDFDKGSLLKLGEWLADSDVVVLT